MGTLTDFVDPDLNASDVLHSSGYAQAAGNSNGGTVSGGAGSDGVSMAQRRQLLYGRQFVKSYTQSQLGQRYGAVKSRTVGQRAGRAYDASSGKFSDKAGYSIRRSTGTRGGVAPTPLPAPGRHTFVEPMGRSHDPFA